MILRDTNIAAALEARRRMTAPRSRQRGFLLNPYRFGGGGGLTYAQEVAADSPVRYWRLNDTSGTTAVGTGGNGTYVNSVTLNQAAFVNGGASALFNASNDTLNGNGYVETNFGTNYTSQFALEFWFNAGTQVDASPTLISKGSYYAATNTDFPVFVTWASAGNLSFLLDAGGDFTVNTTITATGLSAGTDYHVVCNYRSAGLCEIYINGSLAASTTIAHSISTTVRNWRIAARTEVTGGGAGDSGFQGRMGEVAIYSSALSAARIAAHYAARNN